MTDAVAQEFCKRIRGVKERESMALKTAFRIGGEARLSVTAQTTDDLAEAVMAAAALSIPYAVIGGGTNVLVADTGFPGVMIQAGCRVITIKDTFVTAEAGAVSAMVARQSVDAALDGFAWAAGLPGTIGGATYGNAGCFGGEMKDVIASVEAIRLRDGARVTLLQDDCHFSYRASMFKQEPHLILSVTLELSHATDAAAARERMTSIMRERRAHQPQGAFSCGCVFQNYTIRDETDLAVLRREGIEIPAEMIRRNSISAGWLIDQAGLKGERIGGIAVSAVHGNFFENRGKATAADVVMLISFVKRKVRDELGIELTEEVQYIGF